ncbi:MAG: Gfo/Idh/MocA family oxidoreductase, partial [bacterium]|nr:Gfo/Idh/MocA family oxidoreductase [bacterium]
MARTGTTITRRGMLKGSAAGLAALTIVPRHVLGGRGYTPPSDTIQHAVIGVGGMGTGHVKMVNGDRAGKLLAVCDVDENHLARAIKLGGGCKGYKDHREVFDRGDIDVAHIVTPPHWHALMSIDAANAGIDVWCEKP